MIKNGITKQLEAASTVIRGKFRALNIYTMQKKS